MELEFSIVRITPEGHPNSPAGVRVLVRPKELASDDAAGFTVALLVATSATGLDEIARSALQSVQSLLVPSACEAYFQALAALDRPTGEQHVVI